MSILVYISRRPKVPLHGRRYVIPGAAPPPPPVIANKPLRRKIKRRQFVLHRARYAFVSAAPPASPVLIPKLLRRRVKRRQFARRPRASYPSQFALLGYSGGSRVYFARRPLIPQRRHLYPFGAPPPPASPVLAQKPLRRKVKRKLNRPRSLRRIYPTMLAPPPPVGFIAIRKPTRQTRRRRKFVLLRHPFASARINLLTDPRFIAKPTPRKRISSPQISGMPVPQCPDFSPLDPNETVTNTFDLAPWLPTGVTIVSISSVSCAVYQGTDAGAASRIVGSPSLAASPSTGAANSAVLFQVGNSPIAGVTYRLQATIITSDGQTLNPWAHQACSAPN